MNRTYANFYEMLAAACRKNGNGTAVFDGKEKPPTARSSRKPKPSRRICKISA
ncbi:long-chain-fatty-acid--CoA ligase [Neisseria gonorrhoeae]|uniref:Long-chain-fatty-acid--CoA ligase n=1 Tax=Neisseria gonorrhoeae TaxID=485 RepID=A0A378VY22_NEIGO|nr:long-chain-fatty-acid--CoA ligase [Neisseria gonorrhoeae]